MIELTVFTAENLIKHLLDVLLFEFLLFGSESIENEVDFVGQRRNRGFHSVNPALQAGKIKLEIVTSDGAKYMSITDEEYSYTLHKANLLKILDFQS